MHPLEDAEEAGMEDARQAEAGRTGAPFPGSLLPSKPAAQKGERGRGPVIPDRLRGGTEKAVAEKTPRTGFPRRWFGGPPGGLQSGVGMETVLAAAVVTRSNFTSTALPGREAVLRQRGGSANRRTGATSHAVLGCIPPALGRPAPAQRHA